MAVVIYLGFESLFKLKVEIIDSLTNILINRQNDGSPLCDTTPLSSQVNIYCNNMTTQILIVFPSSCLHTASSRYSTHKPLFQSVPLLNFGK
ncbi:hypothetical protein BABINDRAFT_78448 [Babjeviella inositovora NRRL Y-12698]|uniref:Uncharacterized protein n=1 Tax=Babjeviella inositovora NRRL Y-12698 TaxID=984486 RepID=A0A1E3R0M9_9ASCO|nr:uncharacterized protein BABINDRAFT_78448 [Babjeviella inositovora NRRL Y-12698]ODQ82922.1 hypothetical protein BABINDRAFT_78448 [Babjeviella inositovora NRRL Y-12698]